MLGVRGRGVVVFCPSRQHTPPLQLIIATCRVLDHLGALEDSYNAHWKLSLADAVKVVRQELCGPGRQRWRRARYLR